MSSVIMKKLSGAMTSAIAANGKSLAQQITDEACALLVKQIPDMIDRITEGTLTQLREKIDSEQFSEKFVNVLQSKLLADTNKSNSNDETEPFLNKFISLFDKIIQTAIYNNNQSLTMPPKEIVDGIEKYLNKVKDTDTNADVTDTLIARYETAADAVLAAWVPPGPEYKGNPTLDFIDKLREAVKRSASIGDVLFNFALHETIENYKSKNPMSSAPVVATAVKVGKSSNEVPEVTATLLPEPTAPIKGGRGKRTRKVSRKSMSRKNRPNRPSMLTKRNLFL